MYIVTGGAGFIGSNLVKELNAQGEEVIVVDNLSTGSMSNLKGTEFTGFYTTIAEALSDDIAAKGIFHLGMPSSTILYDTDPLLVSRTIEEFLLLMEYSRTKQVRIVLASTSNLYNGNPLPWDEDMPIRVNSYYTETRYYLERLVGLYHQLFNTGTVILRLFSVYGPGEEFKEGLANLVTQLIRAKKEGKSFPVYGDGEQTRDSVFITDAVSAFIQAMRSDITFDVFNVGTGVNSSVNRLAEMIRVKIQYVPNPLTNYVQNQLANTAKIRKYLGWKPSVSVEEGIKYLLRR